MKLFAILFYAGAMVGYVLIGSDIAQTQSLSPIVRIAVSLMCAASFLGSLVKILRQVVPE